ncbi:unnamed protein product [Alternaria sp. RS040]
MTSFLYKLAVKHQDARVHLWGAIEGPYGGYHLLDSYGTVVLFAGGVRITHQLSFVRHLLNAHNSNIAATQKISLVWCITNLDALEWVRSWLDEIAATQHFREVVSIRLYVSRMVSFELGGRSIPAYLDFARVDLNKALLQYDTLATLLGPSARSNARVVPHPAGPKTSVYRRNMTPHKVKSPSWYARSVFPRVHPWLACLSSSFGWKLGH